MNLPSPFGPNTNPDLPPTQPMLGDFALVSGRLVLSPPRLRNVPRLLDPLLPADHPNQQLLDCRTIESWMHVMDLLIHQAWADPSVNFNFTHDYSFLKNDPKNLPAVTVVWEIISEAPAVMTKSGIRNIKPSIREVISRDGIDPRGIIAPSAEGAMIIWAQSIDVSMMFSVYADTWTRMYEYRRKFKEFMTTYAGIFIGTGLQQLFWSESTRDTLYDPPQTEAYPNKSLFYFARVEEQTKVSLAAIENVLIAAGIAYPLTQSTGTTEVISANYGINDSPILSTS